MRINDEGEIIEVTQQIHLVPWPDRLHVASDECVCVPKRQEPDPGDDEEARDVDVWEHNRFEVDQ